MPPIPPLDASLAVSLQAPVIVGALSAWLSARWLPPTMPWTPDLSWLQLRLPTLSLSAHSMSTMLGLVNAHAAIRLAFGLDLMLPGAAVQLPRIVETLNLRLPALAPLAADWRPWSALALLNFQLDTIHAAIKAGMFSPIHLHANLALAASVHSPALPSWRALLAQLKALLPLLSIVASLKLDLAHPAAALERLALTIRLLRRLTLPALRLPQVVLQLIARNDAVARLHLSLGMLPFPQLRLQVALKLKAVLALIPPGMSLGPTGLVLGLPNLLPNPAPMLNAPTLAAASRLSASFVAGLNWQVPIGLDLPLLTVGAPAAALASGFAAGGITATAGFGLGLGLGPIRLSPCDALCDALAAS